MNLNLMSKIGGGTAPLIPTVAFSEIRSHSADGIVIHWDRPIVLTAHIKDAISIIINGGAPVHPQAVHINPNDPLEMVLVHHPDFNVGDVVTWAYDDQHPTETITDANGKEADNQTYAVSNLIVTLGAFSDAFDNSFEI